MFILRTHRDRPSVGADDPVRPKHRAAVSFRASAHTGVGIRPRARRRVSLEGVSKEGGPRPSLFGRFKEGGFSRGKGNRNPFPLEPFFGHFLSGKKVTRRRQKRERRKKMLRADRVVRPYTRLPKPRRKQNGGGAPAPPPLKTPDTRPSAPHHSAPFPRR